MLELTAERAGSRTADDPRARLRLGLADACGWPSASPLPHHRGLELRAPARAHRGARRSARGLAQRRDHHLRHERVRAPTATVRPRGLGRDVRAHAQLRELLAAHRLVARARRQALRPHLHAPCASPTRSSPTARRLDGAATSSPAACMPSDDLHALLPGGSRLVRAHWQRRRHALPADRRTPGSRNMDANRRRSLPIFAGVYGAEEAPQVVRPLAHVLHGLRGALGLRRRPASGSSRTTGSRSESRTRERKMANAERRTAE